MKYYLTLVIFYASHTFCSSTVTPYSVIIEQRYRNAEKAVKSYDAQYSTFQNLTTDGQPHPLTLTDIQKTHEQHEQSLSYEDFPLRERNSLAAIAITTYFQDLSNKILLLNRKIWDFRKSTT